MLTEMRQRVTERLAAPSAGVPLQRANLAQLAQAADELPLFVANCPVAQRYLELLGPLDWEHFPERDPHRPWPGSKPAPRAPYVAAYLVKLDQDKRTMSGLRSYLVEHPALVWVLGFALVPSATAPWGFDVEASVPSRRQLGRVLRQLPNACLQFLLTGLVTALQQELPAEMMFGDAIALDTKHILAWVRENNPKDYVAERHNPAKQPKGDRDCKLGCKRKRNRSAAEGDGSESGGAAPSATAAAAPVAAGSVAPSTTAAAAPVAAGSVAPSATVAASPAAAGSVAPTTPASEPVPASKAAVGEYYWGYASGVAATKVEGWGEFVLGELTQTFDKGDATYFFPLMAQVEQRLGRRPRYGALDMAFDAHYVYDYFDQAGGFAAVPLSERGASGRQFDAAGLPLCAAGLAMPLKGKFNCRTSRVAHQRGRYACPLRFPSKSAEACPVGDAHWAKGGCVVTMPTAAGARIRYRLDRASEEYLSLYKQRTADERINSQALALGIERPKLRNGAAIANQNTLIYVLINLRGLHRVRAHKAELAIQEQTMTGR
jgi:hypothetical protein